VLCSDGPGGQLFHLKELLLAEPLFLLSLRLGLGLLLHPLCLQHLLLGLLLIWVERGELRLDGRELWLDGRELRLDRGILRLDEGRVLRLERGKLRLDRCILQWQS